MISLFPDFKKINLADWKEVVEFTKEYPAYSSFNFSSMWAWDVDQSTKLSKLNDNLIILVDDIDSQEYYCSFIGKVNLKETAIDLMDFLKNKSVNALLKHMPEEVCSKIKSPEFEITLDESSCEHIVLVSNSVNLDDCVKDFRYNCKQFNKNHGTGIQLQFNLLAKCNKAELEELFILWAENKKLNYLLLKEYKAFERYFQLLQANIYVLMLYDKNKIIGFQTIEILSNEYATCEFFKADVSYKGIYQFMEWKTCEYLQEKNVKYLNLQEDLGLPGLKRSKIKANPSFELKNYNIKSVDSSIKI